MTLAELKAQAQALNLSPNDVRAHGALNNKATWQAAIDQAEALNNEAQEENRQARLDAIYHSPGAALIVPVASVAAYGHGLVNSVRRCL